MAGNPLIPQGTLNRIKGSVVWPSFPSLNVSASYLGRTGLRLALDGESTLYVPTMTGAITSPEPFMMITLSIHLLRTQQLAQLYKQQMETLALLGDGTVYSDAPGWPVYSIVNCAVESVREMSFAGDNGEFMVACRGYYLTNANLWN